MREERNIEVELLRRQPSQVEIVERKGLGHPDSLCDGIAEEMSLALSQEYLRECGSVLHHNVDKMLIAAGEADVDFGGGKITKPIYFCLAGRAVAKTQEHSFDVHGICIKACRDYLKKTTRYLDIEDDCVIDSRIGRGSADLVEGFDRRNKKSSNDTSFGVGFAPMSTLEKCVMAIERRLNSRDFKRQLPACGEDIKVMGLRDGNKIRVTIACAFVARELAGLEAYKEAKAKLLEEAIRVTKQWEAGHETEMLANTLDDYDKPSVYITATGLSCENGDDGSVGRGNRVNGLITPDRPMSLEAAAGKNPVTHVGKIYNVAAFQIAEDIARKFPEVRDCEVYLLSEIGKPIDLPKVASIKMTTSDGGVEHLKKDVRALADEWLERIGQGEIMNLLLARKATVF